MEPSSRHSGPRCFARSCGRTANPSAVQWVRVAGIPCPIGFSRDIILALSGFFESLRRLATTSPSRYADATRPKAQPTSLHLLARLTIIGDYLLTRLQPEFRIIAILLLIIACATTTSAASVARHVHATPNRHAMVSSYTVSTTIADQPLDVARETDSLSNIASADQFYNNTKFDDVHGTTNVVRPQVHVVTQFTTRRALVDLSPDVRLTPSLRPGQHKLVQAGRPAFEELSERVVMWDDVVISRQVLRSRTLRHGSAPIVLQGAPLTFDQLAAATAYRKLVGVFTMVATAYTPWTASSSPTGRTATGTQARYGVVAVDPRVIRLGSRVFVPGYGLAIAADTGGAIVGNRIDLCMDSVRDAVIFGRRAVKVYVLGE
jgi:3D (Asp-Asp-Asp) domain-containing protein